MNLNHQAPRRALLAAALGGMASMLLAGRAAAQRMSGVNGGPHVLPMRKVEDEYRRLIPLWRAESERARMFSNPYEYWKGPNGKAIIALGPAIVPYLIAEVRKGDFFFNVPLALITKVDITNGEYTSEQVSSKLWLQWWDKAKESAQP